MCHQNRPKPSDKWMQYLQVAEAKKSDWNSKLPDNGHVLLHIDIPNQQVYPLSLLIMPVKCIYLITFYLPEGKKEEAKAKALKPLHDTLKDVYTYSSSLCEKPEHDAEWPVVFLVGLQREQKDWNSFAQWLKQMLETRSYERLILKVMM